jgi:flagellar hook-basal body complex protein FliE
MSATIGTIPNFKLPSMPSAAPSMPFADPGAGPSGDSFGSILSNAVQGVNQTNDAAAAQVGNLLQGQGGDISNVMVAVEKAEVSFQLMMQVRNKIVSAYQDIEKMQF